MSSLSATCAAVREALSARLDGEASPVEADDVDRHLAACVACRRFEVAVADVGRRTRLAGAPEVPDLSASIVAAVAAEDAGEDRRTRDLRVVVALAGLAQLAVAVPLLLGLVDAGGHLGRDLGAFELALGVGFLLAAWQPHRTAGVLPVAAVVAGTVLVASTLDLATGRATLLMELPHLSELIGVAALWALRRRRSGMPTTMRAAEVH
jgi:predicted anti-sigma-YlaC factor YlaD